MRFCVLPHLLTDDERVVIMCRTFSYESAWTTMNLISFDYFKQQLPAAIETKSVNMSVIKIRNKTSTSKQLQWRFSCWFILIWLQNSFLISSPSDWITVKIKHFHLSKEMYSQIEYGCQSLSECNFKAHNFEHGYFWVSIFIDENERYLLL